MALIEKEIVVSVTGAVKSFPLDSTFAYGANSDLPAGTIDHGFVSSDGVAVTPSTSTTDLIAWQNSAKVRQLTTESSLTFAFTLWQFNDDNKSLYFNADTNSTTGGIHWNVGKTHERRQFIIEIEDPSNGEKIRYWIPSGSVSEVGAQTISAGEALGFELTITAYLTEIEDADEAANVVIFDDNSTPTS